jgi:hypothetical protein
MSQLPGLHPDSALYRTIINAFSACAAPKMVLQVAMHMTQQVSTFNAVRQLAVEGASPLVSHPCAIAAARASAALVPSPLGCSCVAGSQPRLAGAIRVSMSRARHAMPVHSCKHRFDIGQCLAMFTIHVYIGPNLRTCAFRVCRQLLTDKLNLPGWLQQIGS